MSGVNKVILVCRLGKDPEVRHTNSGVVVANLNVATSEVYYNKNTGEKTEQTEWHNVVLWGKIGEVAEKYLSKGDRVYIEGKLRTRSWEKDGVTKYTTEIIANTLTMLGSKKQSAETVTAEIVEHGEDDLPFL